MPNTSPHEPVRERPPSAAAEGSSEDNIPEEWLEMRRQKVTPRNFWDRGWNPSNPLRTSEQDAIRRMNSISNRVYTRISDYIPPNPSQGEPKKATETTNLLSQEVNQANRSPPSASGNLPQYQNVFDTARRLLDERQKGIEESQISKESFCEALGAYFVESRKRHLRAGMTESEIMLGNILMLGPQGDTALPLNAPPEITEGIVLPFAELIENSPEATKRLQEYLQTTNSSKEAIARAIMNDTLSILPDLNVSDSSDDEGSGTDFSVAQIGRKNRKLN